MMLRCRTLLKLTLAIAMLLACQWLWADAAKSLDSYSVSAAFLELRSGPGRGYPVMYTLRRGETVHIEKRKTGWIFIQAQGDEQSGWIHQRQLADLSANEKQLYLQGADSDQYHQRRWELGVSQGGAYNRNNDGTPLIALYGAWFFTHNLSTELTLTHMLGKYAESTTGQLNLTHQMWPEWVVSPFISFGVGNIESEPKSTLGSSQTIESDALNWGIGFRFHLKKRFFLRADVNQYVLLTRRDDLDKVETWKLGIGVFF